MRIALETPASSREFTADDVDLVVELNSDPEVMRFLTGGVPTSVEYVRDKVPPVLAVVLRARRRLRLLGRDRARDR